MSTMIQSAIHVDIVQPDLDYDRALAELLGIKHTCLSETTNEELESMDKDLFLTNRGLHLMRC